MYLSKWSTLTEAAEWLSENRGEHYTWRRVLEEFADTNPVTIAVVIPINTPLLAGEFSDPEEVSFRFPLQTTVSHVWEFLEHLGMGDDFETAAAHPRFLVAGKTRYQISVPVRAKWLRLTDKEVRKFGPTPFDQLLKRIRAGHHPELAAMLEYVQPTLRATAVQAGASLPKSATRPEHIASDSAKAISQGTASRPVRLRRSTPTSGDALTLLIWDICFKLTEETGSQRPAAIMAVLVKLANESPPPYPLVGLDAGIVWYESSLGVEKDLTDTRLRGRMRTWMEKNRVKFSRTGKFIRQD